MADQNIPVVLKIFSFKIINELLTEYVSRYISLCGYY